MSSVFSRLERRHVFVSFRNVLLLSARVYRHSALNTLRVHGLENWCNSVSKGPERGEI